MVEIRPARHGEHPFAPLTEWHVDRAREALVAEHRSAEETRAQFMRDINVRAVMKAEGLTPPEMRQRPMAAEDIVRVLRGEIMELVQSLSPAVKYLAPATYEGIHHAAKAMMIMMPSEAGMEPDDPRICSYEDWENGEGYEPRDTRSMS